MPKPKLTLQTYDVPCERADMLPGTVTVTGTASIAAVTYLAGKENNANGRRIAEDMLKAVITRHLYGDAQRIAVELAQEINWMLHLEFQRQSYDRARVLLRQLHAAMKPFEPTGDADGALQDPKRL
jgi:hypothetical protein